MQRRGPSLTRSRRSWLREARRPGGAPGPGQRPRTPGCRCPRAPCGQHRDVADLARVRAAAPRVLVRGRLGRAGALGQHVRVLASPPPGRSIGVVPGAAPLRRDVRWLGLSWSPAMPADARRRGPAALHRQPRSWCPALHSYWLVIHVSAAIICGAVVLPSARSATLSTWSRDRDERERAPAGEPGACATCGRSARLPAGRVSLGQAGLPGQRVRLPAVDVRRHRGRDLGRGRLGPLLGLGPQGDLGLHHLARLRRLPARPRHRRLAGPQGRRRSALIGFACFLINYFGVNIFASGLHSYAGLCSPSGDPVRPRLRSGSSA